MTTRRFVAFQDSKQTHESSEALAVKENEEEEELLELEGKYYQWKHGPVHYVEAGAEAATADTSAILLLPGKKWCPVANMSPERCRYTTGNRRNHWQAATRTLKALHSLSCTSPSPPSRRVRCVLQPLRAEHRSSGCIRLSCLRHRLPRTGQKLAGQGPREGGPAGLVDRHVERANHLLHPRRDREACLHIWELIRGIPGHDCCGPAL